jgi:hypothetical protein
MDRKAELKANAVESLATLVAYIIRQVHDHNPDHSGPEDEAMEYSQAVVDAALMLLSTVDYGRELPRVVSTQIVYTRNPI